MKTLLINLPHKDKIIRRFMCSYNSPGFLFPPNELLGLAAIIRESFGEDAQLLDCVAEGLDLERAKTAIFRYDPDIIVTLTGLESFEQDCAVLSAIKAAYPAVSLICFGYYPTLFAQETLSRASVDFILLNEPDVSFSRLFDSIKNNADPGGIRGIAFKKDGQSVVNGPSERVRDLDSLPLPGHELLKKELYSEACLGGPFTTIQSSRGCPFSCNYCVKTYGDEVIYRSVENVLSEIEKIVTLGIRKIRFLDDTFNIDKRRVSSICEKIRQKQFNIEWTCLSRVDTLDAGVLKLMQEAGCKRIYLGIESGSQKVLDYYQKGYKAGQIKEKVNLVKAAGIETAAFFLVGAPVEEDSDLMQSIELAKEIGLDFVIVTKLVPYPGTKLFEKNRDSIDFRLFPYRNRFNDPSVEQKGFSMEKRFYAAYYLRFGYLISLPRRLIKHGLSLLPIAARLLSFLFLKRKKEHPDYL